MSAALIVLLATDLDQKILPDWVTLPLIVLTGAWLVAGWSPLLAGKDLGIASGIAAGILAPLFLFVSDRILRGDLGDGDLKLAVSVGLLTGISLLVTGLLVASILFSARSAGVDRPPADRSAVGRPVRTRPDRGRFRGGADWLVAGLTLPSSDLRHGSEPQHGDWRGG